MLFGVGGIDVLDSFLRGGRGDSSGCMKESFSGTGGGGGSESEVGGGSYGGGASASTIAGALLFVSGGV